MKLFEKTTQVSGGIRVTGSEELRPCWVRGEKALFHRWANSARPATAKGVLHTDENARFFQLRQTHAVVEFENGLVDTVWPQEVRFADSAERFRGNVSGWPRTTAGSTPRPS